MVQMEKHEGGLPVVVGMLKSFDRSLSLLHHQSYEGNDGLLVKLAA